MNMIVKFLSAFVILCILLILSNCTFSQPPANAGGSKECQNHLR